VSRRRTGEGVGGELRRRRIPVHARRAGGNARRGGAGDHMTRPARILLVDDETSIQRAVAPLLRARGYTVELVGTGADALEAVASRAPDLIVLDLGLPDVDGVELCVRLREESKAPIVVLSARSGEAGKVKVLDL